MWIVPTMDGSFHRKIYPQKTLMQYGFTHPIIKNVYGEKTMTDGQKPLKTYSAGGVRATIWENKGKDKSGNEYSFHNVVIQRVYKDGDEWKETNSFRTTDLPKVRLVAEKSFDFLSMKQTDE